MCTQIILNSELYRTVYQLSLVIMFIDKCNKEYKERNKYIYSLKYIVCNRISPENVIVPTL